MNKHNIHSQYIDYAFKIPRYMPCNGSLGIRMLCTCKYNEQLRCWHYGNCHEMIGLGSLLFICLSEFTYCLKRECSILVKSQMHEGNREGITRNTERQHTLSEFYPCRFFLASCVPGERKKKEEIDA